MTCRFGADDDLVFGHPHLGTPLERSLLLKRCKAAVCGSAVASACSSHAATLFPVFLADVRKRDLQPPGPFVATHVSAALTAEKLPRRFAY